MTTQFRKWAMNVVEYRRKHGNPDSRTDEQMIEELYDRFADRADVPVVYANDYLAETNA